jgi:anti-sigma B factor antagonist
MFDIKKGDNQEILLIGRFDAAQTDKARAFLIQINETATINLEKLDYISSAGLGVLVMVQKRLKEKGEQIILKRMNKNVKEILMIARFDLLFEIDD